MGIKNILKSLPKQLNLLLIIALATFGSVTNASAQKWQPEVKKVRVNNYDLAYVEHGKGPPLILIHGGLSDYRTWLPLIKELSETSRTIAVSLRHYYPEKWDGKGDDFTLQQHADDVAAFIKSLELGPVDLLGHSRGALVSMLVASQNPDMVRNLVLADPSPLQSMLAKTPRAQKLMEKRRAIMQKTINFYRQGNPETGLEHFVNYIAGPDAWKKTNEIRRKTLRDNSWTQVSHLKDLEMPFHCSNVSKISSPVLMITGERSAPLYGYMLSALKPCFKQANNALIADAGHMMYSANPTAFIFEVQDFIAPQ